MPATYLTKRVVYLMVLLAGSIAVSQDGWAAEWGVSDSAETAHLNREISRANEKADENFARQHNQYQQQRAEYERQQREYEQQLDFFESKNGRYRAAKDRYERSIRGAQ